MNLPSQTRWHSIISATTSRSWSSLQTWICQGGRVDLADVDWDHILYIDFVAGPLSAWFKRPFMSVASRTLDSSGPFELTEARP